MRPPVHATDPTPGPGLHLAAPESFRGGSEARAFRRAGVSDEIRSDLGAGPDGGGVLVLDPPTERPRFERADPPAPPRDGDGGSGDDGRGDEPPAPGDGAASEGSEDEERETRAVFALGLALAGVTTLFCVLLATWALLRSRSDGWPPPGAPEPPDALWLSNALLFASSLALLRGQRVVRHTEAGRPLPREYRGWAALSACLGLAFLAAQVHLWRQLGADGLHPSTGGYGTIFYGLTATHALHVVVGLLLLTRLTCLSLTRHVRIRVSTRVAATYWHFLGLLWAVLFVLLYYVR